MSAGPLSIDAGLLARFRAAGAAIAWRPAPTKGPRGRRAQIAHLHDEEARIEEWGRTPGGGVEVDSGPVGALVILLEADRRGALPSLEAHEAGAAPRFPQGALAATWGVPPTAPGGPTVRDLVELARYALT